MQQWWPQCWRVLAGDELRVRAAGQGHMYAARLCHTSSHWLVAACAAAARTWSLCAPAAASAIVRALACMLRAMRQRSGRGTGGALRAGTHAICASWNSDLSTRWDLASRSDSSCGTDRHKTTTTLQMQALMLFSVIKSSFNSSCGMHIHTVYTYIPR